MSTTPNYYSILPANVRYDKRLSASEKVFYSEITALTNMNGVCNASRAYFANLYGVSKSTISVWTTRLKDLGFIEVEQIMDGKLIVERVIRLVSIESNDEQEVVRKTEKGWEEKPSYGGSKNLTENTNLTDSNNTLTESNNNNYVESEKKQPKKHSDIDEVVSHWNESFGCNMRVTEPKKRSLSARLKTFTVKDIKTAISNRASNKWFWEEGAKYRNNLDEFLKSAEKIDKYLNMVVDTPEHNDSTPSLYD